MKKHDKLRTKLDPPRGVLHIPSGRSAPGLRRFLPSKSIAPFVEHYWEVTWSSQTAETRETIPSPCVHLVFESEQRGGQSGLHGLYPSRFSKEIVGEGCVRGVKFAPGGFRAFSSTPASKLTGKIVAPAEEFGDTFYPLERAVLESVSADQAFLAIDSFLASLGPCASPEFTLVKAIVGTIEQDPSITRVEALARQQNMGLRAIQRLFREWVGASPKWVIRRYRLIEAAERLALVDWPSSALNRSTDPSPNLARLGLDLGYSDQAHFIRDFRTFVGVTPRRYQRALQSRS